MPTPSPAFVSEFLNFVEECEQKLQNWGFFNVAFDALDLGTLLESEAPEGLKEAWANLSSEGLDLETLINSMRRADLLYLVPDGSGRVRSRFAEGLRLMAHLRQRFSFQDWASGRRLVSDIKLHLAPRRYPETNISADHAWKTMAPHATDLLFQRDIYDALSSRGDGSKFVFAGFQQRSFERILGAYGTESQNGTVVCAGTGAGKTKAFYIPAFTAAAADIKAKGQPFTKVVAVYPRNVLLADQLREAISEAGKIAPVMKRHGARSITFGALLGDLPPKDQFDRPDRSLFLKNWKRVGNGWVVPFLRAPFHADRSELVWLDSDRRAGRTTLYRLDAVTEGPEIPDGVLQLTREGLQANPPDILFLSLEMMHRELGNPLWAKTLGINATEKPRLLLFDEVHNYSGLSGAQAPWIIARWKQASWLKGLHVVGLSATLREAPKHLATIGCVNPEKVVECTPTEDELVPEGRDYTVLVKGDAASGASLLATSIQLAMLQSRLLTPSHIRYPLPGTISSKSVYLRKVFGFTDQLDSLNRWLPDLNDAEWNRLAQYRMPSSTSGQIVLPAIERAMAADGQIWSLSDKLGYDLQQPGRVSRCSSQDPGTDTLSDIIVATASLEVGYDDPDVGAVIHHKAPRSIASFLQRKGRAGRTRGSRPSTLVALSDWGRDRWLFQNSERLFQPTIDPIKVPMLNPYVQHVQATSFLIDWIGRKVGAADPIRYLARPGAYAATARKKAVNILRKILNLGDEYTAFSRELGWVVRNTQQFRDSTPVEIDRVVEEMLWESPRPVIRHAVPALLRKLETEWRIADPHRGADREDRGARQPLPNFIPSASFAELAASDVVVEFPGTDKDPEVRGIAHQLAEACPGRVSKRFSVRRQEDGFWLAGSEALLTTASPIILSVNQLFPDCIMVGMSEPIRQPVKMALTQRPNAVKDSSNAQWQWETNVETIGDGRTLPLATSKKWHAVFRDVKCYLHGELEGVLVRRKASEGRFDLLMDGGVERRGTVILGSTSDNGHQTREPVGFELTVDAVVFSVKREHLQTTPTFDSSTMGRLRQDYFKYILLTSDILRSAASSFTLDWVFQTCLAMLTATALRHKCTLHEAQTILAGNRLTAIGRVLSRMFSISTLDDEGADDHQAGGKARERLEVLWRDQNCADEIVRAEAVLWAELGDDFRAWTRKRHMKTLAEACLSAVLGIANDITEGDLVVDVIDDGNDASIVLSENAPGGIGQIEAFVQTALEDEGVFDRALSHAIDYCPRESVRTNLISVISNARSRGNEIALAFQGARRAKGYLQLVDAQARLTDALDKMNLTASRQNVVSISTRFLQPASSSVTDAWSDGANRYWAKCEKKLAAPIDLRVFSYFLMDSALVRRRFFSTIVHIAGQQPSEAQMFARVQDFLVAGCRDTCPQCLASTNAFDQQTRPSRELTKQWICESAPPVATVDVGPGWTTTLQALLAVEDSVHVLCSSEAVEDVAGTLQSLLANPLERDYLQVWPIISAVHRTENGWRVSVEIRNMGPN